MYFFNLVLTAASLGQDFCWIPLHILKSAHLEGSSKGESSHHRRLPKRGLWKRGSGGFGVPSFKDVEATVNMAVKALDDGLADVFCEAYCFVVRFFLISR